MSEFSTQGLSLSLWKPNIVITAGTPNAIVYTVKGQGVHVKWAEEISSYDHSIVAMGGFDTASFGIALGNLDYQYWFENGLGYHVEMRDETYGVVWEGRVNQINIELGGFSHSRGPLLEVSNRLSVVYDRVESYSTTTVPQSQGRMVTAVGESADSQSLYGICYGQYAAKSVTDTIATQIRDKYLQEYRWPKETKQLAIGAGGPAAMTFECLGYSHWLNYPYTNSTGGTTPASTRIAAILNAGPNGFFASQIITTNALAVASLTRENADAWGLIKEVCSMGDAAFNRYLFGVYEERQCRYEAVGTTISYEQSLFNRPEVLFEKGQGYIQPWQARPGKWLLVTDLLPGSFANELTPAQDPRTMFVESVQYTAPRGLTMQGGKANRLDQMLAQYGLSGEGG